MVTLTGSNFGETCNATKGLRCAVHWGEDSEPSSSVIDHSDIVGTLGGVWTAESIVFPMPEGQGRNRPIDVVAGGARSATPVLFHYDPPRIDEIDPNHGPTDGCAELENLADWRQRACGKGVCDWALRRRCAVPVAVTIRGASFGVRGLSLFITQDGADVRLGYDEHEHEQIVFPLQPGLGADLNITLTLTTAGEDEVRDGPQFCFAGSVGSWRCLQD